MAEQWKAIPGYDGDYEVSDLGRARSRKRGTWRMRKPEIVKDGYLRVGLSVNSKRKRYLVHRLVAKAFIGPAPSNKHEVNHKDADKTNNRPNNLKWATSSENKVHAERMGLMNHVRGEKHGRSKLAADQVIELRRLHALGKTHHELAKKFDISCSHTRHITCRAKWKHLA